MAGLGALAERSLEQLGDHVSLVFDGTRHRAAVLHERATRLAGGFVAAGVQPGDRVVVCMANAPEVLLCYAALWRCGAVPTPVIPAVTPVELRHVLLDSAALLVICSPGSLQLVREAAEGTQSRVVLAAVSAAPGAPVLLSELESCAPAPLTARDDTDVAALLYTGGTTGRAKGVVLSHGGLARIAQARATVIERSGAVDLLLALPLSHVYGLLNAVTRLYQREPGFVCLQAKFDARGWIELAQQWRPQSAALVPSMMQLLLRESLGSVDLTSLRYITTGGAPLPVTVRETFEQQVPSARVCDGYGCTEVTSTATMNPYDAARSGSVGLPVPGVELRVIDPAGNAVADGTDGEICVRSPGVMVGYWRDPQATDTVLQDGWLRTGDLGHVDDEGYLWIVDRLKDLIIRGGFNVYPRDVEDALLEHPSVAAAAVVGRPDELYGEEVVAYVALVHGADAGVDELLAFAGDRLARHKRPRELHIVDAVPLTSVGKLDRKQLRVRAHGGT